MHLFYVKLNFKKSHRLGLLLLLILTPFINASNSNNNYQNAIEASRKYLKKCMKKTGNIGMSVVVVANDKIVYSEGFGYADKEIEKSVTDSTTFRVGSVTKLFTATAIMQLVEDELIVLDSPIVNYLPEFTIKSRFESEEITVRDLLTHQSGLPSDIYNGWLLGQIPSTDPNTLYRNTPEILSNEFVANPRRKITSYCNIGFSLLGVIIEKVSNQNYADYIQSNIFKKLKMNHSGFNFNSEFIKPNFSKCYYGENIEHPFYIRDLPAGSLISSSYDLSKFLISLFSEEDSDDIRILKKETQEKMWTSQNSDISLDFDTLGITYWLSNTTRIPSRIAYHGGDIPPFHAMLGVLPDEKLGVVVLVNSEQGGQIPGDAAKKLLEEFYEDKTGKVLPYPLKKKRQAKVKISEENLNSLAGFYTSNLGMAEAKVKNGKIKFNLMGKNVTFVPHSDSTASLRYKLFGLIPIPSRFLKTLSVKIKEIDKNQIAIIQADDNSFRLVAKKYEPKTPPTEWINRAGVYEITNTKSVSYLNEEIEKRHKMPNFMLFYDSTNNDLSINGVPIQTISTTEALTRGMGRGAGETIKAYTEDNQEYLWAWGYSLKKVIEPENKNSGKSN